MKGSLLVLAIFLTLTGYGQVKLSVDKTEIRIGDQVIASITTDLTQGKEWINSDVIWPDTLSGIEIVSGPKWNKEKANATTASWVIAVFDTGWVRIPALPVVFKQNGETDTFFTNDIPLNVLAVEPDSSGLRAIKEIYLQPFSPGYYKKYLPHLLVLAVLITGLIFWFRHRKKNKVVEEYLPLPPSPHEWAYRALEELAERKLWQRGEIKEHYTLLTAILREYLERRYDIHALEQTSDEILAQLRKHDLKTDLLQDTDELLSVADLIKFAKADPGMDLHAATIDRVRVFVKETALTVKEELNSQTNTSGDETVE